MSALDITGQRYGALVAASPTSDSKHGSSIWLFKCDCGNDVGRPLALVRARQKRGNWQACAKPGCGFAQRSSTTFKKGSAARLRHGAHRRGATTVEYTTWTHMIGRCHNPKNKRFEYYGARGIAVCARWRGELGFDLFLADMGPRPPGMRSIERRDNSQGYEPGNCKWSNYQEQNRNKRSNRLVTIGNETLCVTDWAARNGIKPATAFRRIYSGWDIVAAVTLPAVPASISGRRGAASRMAGAA
jgi:hypothetical protein